MSEKPGNKQQGSQGTHQPAPLGGARADFVASLGRKTNDARGVLNAVLAERGTSNERASREDFEGAMRALATLRAPLFEDKVVDFLTELATVTDKQVSRDELFKEDEA